MVPCSTARCGNAFRATSRAHPRRKLRVHAIGNFFGQMQKAVKPQEKQAQTGNPGGVEFPPYQIVKKTDVYSIRFYPAYPAVEAAYARRDQGYEALGGYVDGQNSEKVRFVETQPVVMCYPKEGPKTMRLYIGSRRDAAQQPKQLDIAQALASLPQPSNSAVRLQIGGGETVAVLRFEGYITPVSAEAARKKLLAALQQDGVQLAEFEAAGGFRVAQYGPMYSLSTRINEMLLQIRL